MSKKKKRFGSCAYCGAAGGTRDHVIPRNLFGDKLPTLVPMITVPACEACNNKKSADERYLRDILALEIQNYDHLLKTFFATKLAQNTIVGKSKVGNDLYKSPIVELKTPSGLIHYATAVPVDFRTVERVLTMLIHGLYYHFWNQRISEDYKFTIMKFRPVKELYSLIQTFLMNPNCKIIDLGDEDEVFACVGMRDEVDHNTTRWFLSFYRKICFVIQSDPPL